MESRAGFTEICKVRTGSQVYPSGMGLLILHPEEKPRYAFIGPFGWEVRELDPEWENLDAAR